MTEQKEFSIDDIKVDENDEFYIVIERSFRIPVLLNIEGSGKRHVNVLPAADNWIRPEIGASVILDLCRRGFREDKRKSTRVDPITVEFLQTQIENWAKFWLTSTVIGSTNMYQKFTVTQEQYDEILTRKDDVVNEDEKNDT